ncbi:MAG: TonB-dependent receptor domain-containing protein, partial [Steroidobacteraceae bacterium]
YRPASANLGLVDPSTGNVLSVPFVDADTLWSYEIGAKGSVLDGALGYDVAVYRLNWKDMQVFRSFMGVNVGGNADSDVTAHGVEATVTLQPSSSFDFVGSIAYSQSELNEDDRSIGGVEGEQLPGIPQWTLSLSSTYRFPIGSLEAFVGGGIVYQDERKTSFIGGIGSNGVPIAPPNPNYTVPDYTTVDLRAGVTMGRYSFSVYATNAFDEYAFQRATTNTVQGTATILRPRTIGAVFSAEF